MARARSCAILGLIVAATAGSYALAAPASGLTVDFSAPPLDLPIAATRAPMAPVTPAAPPSAAPNPPVAAPTAAPSAPAPAPTAPPPRAATPVAVSNQAITYGEGDLAARPTAQQIIDAYPAAARLMSVRAKVVMTCQVAASGAVHDCLVASTASRGSGFADSALKLQSYYRMNPKTVNGQAMPGTTSLLINFSPSDLKAAGGVWSAKP